MSYDFEVKIAKDLYWVPLSILGNANYTITELEMFSKKSVEEKKSLNLTLLDAVNLFRLSNFEEYNDVIMQQEDNGIIWEHHKPGYYSVLTNGGCCASCASWLAFLLEDKYEKMGFLCYIRTNQSGHCINYIYHEGWYYFIDMSLQVEKYRSKIAKETGKIEDYLVSRPIANVFMKAGSISAYVEYLSKYYKLQNRTFLFSKLEGTVVPPISLYVEDDRIHVLYPLTYNIEIIEKNIDKDNFCYEYVAPPQKKPLWEIAYERRNHE